MEWGQGGVKGDGVGSGLTGRRNMTGGLTGMLIQRGFFIFVAEKQHASVLRASRERNELVTRK